MIDPNLMVRIQQRAYEIWENEGRPAGRDRIHWLRAEAEFRESLCARKPAPPSPKPKPQKTSRPSARATRADRAH